MDRDDAQLIAEAAVAIAHAIQLLFHSDRQGFIQTRAARHMALDALRLAQEKLNTVCLKYPPKGE